MCHHIRDWKYGSTILDVSGSLSDKLYRKDGITLGAVTDKLSSPPIMDDTLIELLITDM